MQLPKLTRLKYGNPYCQGCHATLHPGWQVAWWPTTTPNNQTRRAVYCAACHHDKTRIADRPA